MPDTTRHQNFVTQITTLLSSQADVNVSAMDNPPDDGYPYCFIWLGADEYDFLRDEAGRILTDGVQHGECEFNVFTRFRTARDTAKSGTVADEARRLSHIIEKAVKYGGTLEEFDTDDFTLYIDEITPTFTLDFTGDDTSEGTVQVSGIIRYRQVDKTS